MIPAPDGALPSLLSRSLIIFTQTTRENGRTKEHISWFPHPSDWRGPGGRFQRCRRELAKIKATEPIGMRRLHSSRSSREAAAAAAKLGRARTVHELSSPNTTRQRSTMTTAPVNQIMTIIQNTATGLLTSIKATPTVLPFHR